MDTTQLAYFELKFKNRFLESHGNSFQEFFVEILSKLYPNDFIACAPWGNIGDRKNDGYIKSEDLLFQVYAPQRINANKTIQKIEVDFNDAIKHWGTYIKSWVFVHNSSVGLPPQVIEKPLDISQRHQNLKIDHWGYEELLLCVRKLSLDNLISLFGKPLITEPKKKPNLTSKAQELAHEGKYEEAMEKMATALSIAIDEGDDKEEVEILIGMSLLSSAGKRKNEGAKYFSQASKKIDKIESPVVKVMYLRAQAKLCSDNKEDSKAIKLLKQAIQMTVDEKDDDKENLAVQGCLMRSICVHHLCDKRQFKEAKLYLDECEAYACRNPQKHDGELLLAALEAGIHYSSERDDNEGISQRIIEIEKSITSDRQANRIANSLLNITNRLSHQKNYRTALYANEVVVRIAHKWGNKRLPGLLTAALYTEAAIIARMGDDNLALIKAEALLNLCKSPDEAIIKQAVQHLISEIKRLSGDSQIAVDKAMEALKSARGRPEEIAFTKMALANALDDNGETEKALKQIKEAWHLLPRNELDEDLKVDFLSRIADYASQLGLNEDIRYAQDELKKITSKRKKIENRKAHSKALVGANLQLRHRLLEIMKESEVSKPDIIKTYSTFQEANIAAFQPLLNLWEDVPESSAVCYDFWGRGSFTRILNNANAFNGTFNITIEVRCLDDIKNAIRLWCLYTDLLILLWKGPTNNGMAMFPLPEDYWEPGGANYMVAYGDEYVKEGSDKKYHYALAQISMFPDDVINFLISEAKPLMQLGKVIVVPAVSAGCVNPGHGPFEQLITEASNSIPSLRNKGIKGYPIGMIPYSPDVPFSTLADLFQSEGERLKKLRILLLKQSQKFSSSPIDFKIFTLEIFEALQEIEEQNKKIARKKGLHSAQEPLNISTTQFLANKKKLSDIDSESPYSPLYILDNLGYGWKIAAPSNVNQSGRYEPEKNNLIGSWLAPPKPGWLIPTIKK